MGFWRPLEAAPSLEEDEVEELRLSIVEARLVRLGEMRGFRTRLLIGSLSSFDGWDQYYKTRYAQNLCQKQVQINVR